MGNGRALLRLYGPAAVVTAAIWVGAGVVGGRESLTGVVALTLLELLFSLDNAAMNARLLGQLSAWWRRLFMTVGVLVAVFGVRLAVLVAVMCGASGSGLFAFGATFLVMVAVGYFLDPEKDTHWIGWVEWPLARLGRCPNLGLGVMVVVALVLYATTGRQAAVLVGAVAGVGLHVALGLVESLFGHGPSRGAVLVGSAAAVMFVRIELLDASLSFDGVIGAFAISSSAVVILAGLAAGAMWVRSMTAHMCRAETLDRYRYLGHGAHWAIAVLGLVMAGKLYHVEAPEMLVAAAGLLPVVGAVASSVAAGRRERVAA